VTPVLVLGAAVRLLGIGNTDLWGDEAYSIMTALGPLRALLTSLSVGEPHPPLYPLLLAGLLRAFGRSEVVARLPSAFVGIASIAVAAAIAKYIVPRDERRAAVLAAVVAALFVALNPIQVWYSQEARMYAQLSFFAGLASLALLRLWEGRRCSRTFYVLAIVGCAGSHYYGLFVPIAHTITVAGFARSNWPAARRFVGAGLVASILYLPWVVYARQIFFGYYAARPGSVDLVGIGLSSWVRVAAGWSLTWQHAELAAAALSLLALVGAALPARSSDDAFTRTLLVTWLVVPYLGGYLISLVRPLYQERYLVVSSLPLILLIVRAIARAGEPLLHWRPRIRPRYLQVVPIARGAASGLAIGVVLAAGLVALDQVWLGRYVKSTYDTHVRDVAALFRPGDAVILDGTSQLPLYDYYLPQPWPTYSLPAKMPLDSADVVARLTKIQEQHRGVWVFLYGTPDYDPGYVIPRWLTANAYRGFDDWAVTGRLQYYRFAASTDLTSHDFNVTFGDAIRLERVSWDSSGLTAGDTLPVSLHLVRLANQPIRARVSFRLLDSDGSTWAQTDEEIGGDFFNPPDWARGAPIDDRHGILVPPGTPPGNYRLVVNVYLADGTTLPISGDGATVLPSGVVAATIPITSASRTIWAAGIGGFQPSQATYGDAIELLGYAGADKATAGGTAFLTLIWQALADHPPFTRLQIELVAANGSAAETRDLSLTNPGYPTTKWLNGDVVREQYNIPLSSRLAGGTYVVRAEPVLANGAPAGPATVVGRLKVAAGPPEAAAVPPQHPTADTLGNAIALDGFDLSTNSVAPGSTVQLTLHWRSLAELDQDETVFVHVLDSADKIVAQRDQPPVGGKRPTSSWFPGDQVVDDESIALPANLPPGPYRIEIGMYDPGDGQRLAVTSGGQTVGDRIILATLEVSR
jgi:4-amino-4-deoxy-L-arabinose transferase-like glycosyltransferase